MDLYVQIGVLFMFLTAFAIVASVNSDALDIAKTTFNVLSEESVNYTKESSVTSKYFTVDARNFEQWAFNTSDANEVYLMFNPSHMSNFSNSGYDAYKYKVALTVVSDRTDNTYEIDNQAPLSTRNSIIVEKGKWQSERAVEWLANFAKDSYSHRSVSIYAIPNKSTGQLIYFATGEEY